VFHEAPLKEGPAVSIFLHTSNELCNRREPDFSNPADIRPIVCLRSKIGEAVVGMSHMRSGRDPGPFITAEFEASFHRAELCGQTTSAFTLAGQRSPFTVKLYSCRYCWLKEFLTSGTRLHCHDVSDGSIRPTIFGHHA
jgi:hypothetical protein